MRPDRVPLNHVGGLGIFDLMVKALTVLPWERERFERAASPAGAPAPRRGVLDSLDHWFWRHKQRALDGHLSRAQDVFDLEARIRDLERGAICRYY